MGGYHVDSSFKVFSSQKQKNIFNLIRFFNALLLFIHEKFDTI